MDERTDATAAFALRLAADLLTTLVVLDVVKKRYAHTLIDESLKAVIASHPDHEQQLREVAATLTTQVSLVAIDFDRKMGRDPP